jgi:hypothetical protein
VSVVTDRPLVEQVWHADVARLRGGSGGRLDHGHGVEDVSACGRATPQAGRRLVVAFNGDGIWFRNTKPGLRWYRLRPEQDHALRVIVSLLL